MVVAYVIVVLGVDTLAALGLDWPLRWSWFQWQGRNGFDLFKFIFWFVVPFLCCVPRMDWDWFGIKRWKRIDAILLALLVACCVGAVLLVPYLPGVRDYYRQFGGALSAAQKWNFFIFHLVWTFSWLIGWEFLHRYALLRRADAAWPRFGWLLVPLSETLYHLQKPPIEAAGMALFALVATAWTRNRRNMLAPFIAHLAIEIALGLFLLLG